MTRKSLKTDGSYMAEVGPRLRNIRQSLGMSLVQAAEKVGCSSVAISSWERADRNPSIDQLGRLAAAYGVTVATFLPDVAADPTVLPADQIAASLQVLALELGELTSAVEAIRASVAVPVAQEHASA